MNGPFDVPEEFVWQDPCDLQGRGGTAAFRLTRKRDGSCLLLHEVGADCGQRCADRVVCETLPSFGRPFVTPLLGPVQLSGQYFLMEAIPPSVSLPDAWKTVISESPQSASSVLLEAARQIDQLLRYLASHQLCHGAVCAENVILTTGGTYGLLAARLEYGGDSVWIRQPDSLWNSSHRGRNHMCESVLPILSDIVNGALPEARAPARQLT
jgi:hypothetical protein